MRLTKLDCLPRISKTRDPRIVQSSKSQTTVQKTYINVNNAFNAPQYSVIKLISFTKSLKTVVCN